MAFFLVPIEMRKNIGGHAGFQDRNLAGMGVPGYMSMRGYQGFEEPTAIGARYYPPQPDFDEETDNAIPIAVGYKANGGREAYRQRVWNAAKKDPKKYGFSKKDLELLGPEGYGPDWTVTPRYVVGGSQSVNRPFLEAPGRERPDYTIFSFPAATVTDTSQEEVEIDQALSLQGRMGRDFLGAQVGGIIGQMNTEHLTIATADHQMEVLLQLNTRTGAFTYSDPEQLWRWQISTSVTAPTTATSQGMIPTVEDLSYGEPELYVAPRLFFRLNNDIDASILADVLHARIASIGIRLSFELFVELLERFADVTLL